MVVLWELHDGAAIAKTAKTPHEISQRSINDKSFRLPVIFVIAQPAAAIHNWLFA
ncbi:hypothetical protein ACHMW6_12895 [Pseudoduganella sp. UC29_106]|uniref:hypothetical protein n=1 Tax=Pseudoduganella sp. UC29_106 TaxID=3374553 RepID=UPI00375631CA